MGKRKKKAICLYLPEETLERLNQCTQDYDIDRNTIILAAIEMFLESDGDANEHELVGYLEIAGITLDDVVKLVKRAYREKFEKIGIPVD